MSHSRRRNSLQVKATTIVPKGATEGSNPALSAGESVMLRSYAMASSRAPAALAAAPLNRTKTPALALRNCSDTGRNAGSTKQRRARLHSRTEFPAYHQTFSTSTRNGCSSILAINNTSHCFVRRPQRHMCPRCPSLAYARPWSRLVRLLLIYEIPLSGQIRQNPLMCNRRYRRRCSTCSGVLPSPHPFPGDRVAVSGWVQGGWGFVVVTAA